MRQRESHRGFSLTEVLMAAAILGVGLTMVASVFPVAVDQSRQGVDTTMAALSARSVAAVLRAQREKVLRWCRDQEINTDDLGPINLTTLLEDTPLPRALRCYNPQQFLYPPTSSGTDEVRSYESNSYVNLWSAGSYVPVVYATPMNTVVQQGGIRDGVAKGKSTTEGPWRITILICKSRGEEPQELGDTWARNRSQAGGYVVHHAPVDVGHRKICRGEAYMVERLVGEDSETLVYPASLPVQVAWGSKVKLYGPSRVLWGHHHAFLSWSLHTWLSFPDAVAAYHTVLGE